jgi:hypothetical protein
MIATRSVVYVLCYNDGEVLVVFWYVCVWFRVMVKPIVFPVIHYPLSTEHAYHDEHKRQRTLC